MAAGVGFVGVAGGFVAAGVGIVAAGGSTHVKGTPTSDCESGRTAREGYWICRMITGCQRQSSGGGIPGAAQRAGWGGGRRPGINHLMTERGAPLPERPAGLATWPARFIEDYLRLTSNKPQQTRNKPQ
eukprot:1188994-Prorocentrum_minimum.AAC.2